MNHWIITKDFIDGELVGTKSPNCPEDISSLKIKFRMFDDDCNLYFEGRMNTHEFDPLDDIGAAYGCTELKFMDNIGIWMVL